MRIPRFAKAVVWSLVLIVSLILDTTPAWTTGADFTDVTKETISILGTVITVTETADELNSDGDCSLREAVQAANTDASVDACLAGSGEDTIWLSGLTYTLSIGDDAEDENAEGDLDITGVLTISGTGAATTIVQAGTDTSNGIDRVLHVLDSSNLTIQDVHIRHGRIDSGAAPHINGGGVYVADNGLLNVDNSIISNNRAANSGGIWSSLGTTVNIDNSTISNNVGFSGGGGMRSTGTVNIRNTTFHGNTANDGGALFVWLGRVNIANSTFSEKTVVSDDPGSSYGGYGGAINNHDELNIINSTFSGNIATDGGGGIRNENFGTVLISNSTLTNNGSPTGGGILNPAGVVTVTNSIIANNVGGDCDGTIISSDYNIDSDNTCNLTQPNDQPNIDPLLDSLANNGGLTWTHALSPGSLAIDTGNCSGGTISEDQRGVIRPQGHACDIGAFESRHYLLTANLSGASSDTVTSEPAGIDCPSDCSESYPARTVVTLTATADTGAIFTGWSGDCVGTNACVVTMDAAKNVTAAFIQVTDSIYLPIVSNNTSLAHPSPTISAVTPAMN